MSIAQGFLQPEPLDMVMPRGTVTPTFPGRTSVYSHGPDQLYCVVSGAVLVSRTIEVPNQRQGCPSNIREFTVGEGGLLFEGDFFGVAPLVGPRCPFERARCLERSVLMLWSYPEAANIIRQNPQVALSFAGLFGLRYAQLDAETEDRQHIKRHALARLLARWVDRCYPGQLQAVLPVWATDQIFSVLLGTSREIVTAAFQPLYRAKAVGRKVDPKARVLRQRVVDTIRLKTYLQDVGADSGIHFTGLDSIAA